MSIRRAPRKETYTNIDNIVFNSKLSYRAIGLLCFLLSKPDNWKVSPSHLWNEAKKSSFPVGRDTVYAIIDELKKAGFIVAEQNREGGKMNGYDYIVFDQPQKIKPNTDIQETAPHPVEPDSVAPYPAETTQVNTDKEVNTEKKSSKDLSSSDDVAEVFEHWKQVMGKASNAKLTDKRRKCIMARIKDGYHVAEIKRAIDNCSRSPHHMGRNDTGTVYNDLTLICRSGDKLEWFMNDVGAKPPTRGDARRHVEPGKTDYRSDTCGMELAN